MADARPFAEPSRLPDDVKIVQVTGAGRVTARRVATYRELPVDDDMGNAKRIAHRMQRIAQTRGTLVLTAHGDEIAWLAHAKHFARILPDLHQHVGIDPCDDWSTEGIEYHFNGDVVRFPAGKETSADHSHKLIVKSAGVSARICDDCANALGGLGLHDDITIAIGIRNAQDDAAIRSFCHTQRVHAVDDSHTNSPSGSSISPKVAEAGESESPLPGGGGDHD